MKSILAGFKENSLDDLAPRADEIMAAMPSNSSNLHKLCTTVKTSYFAFPNVSSANSDNKPFSSDVINARNTKAQ